MLKEIWAKKAKNLNKRSKIHKDWHLKNTGLLEKPVQVAEISHIKQYLLSTWAALRWEGFTVLSIPASSPAHTWINPCLGGEPERHNFLFSVVTETHIQIWPGHGKLWPKERANTLKIQLLWWTQQYQEQGTLEEIQKIAFGPWCIYCCIMTGFCHFDAFVPAKFAAIFCPMIKFSLVMALIIMYLPDWPAQEAPEWFIGHSSLWVVYLCSLH